MNQLPIFYDSSCIVVTEGYLFRLNSDSYKYVNNPPQLFVLNAVNKCCRLVAVAGRELNFYLALLRSY